MFAKSWIRSIFSASFANRRKQTKSKASYQPLQLLTLEDRITPSTFTVLNVDDSGAGSLRQAIIDANNTAADDSIDFNFGSGIITLQSALPTIVTAATAGTLTINGLGASSLTISGDNGNSGRDFNIFNIDNGGNLTISGVTVSGAKTSGNGGAFNNSGTLTLSNSTLSGNSAVFGGGINNYGTVTVTNSTLSGNSAGGGGGGIANGGTLTVTNSTLSGNSASYQGGGILNIFGSVTVTNSTLSGNSAVTGGGFHINSGSTLTLSNSTLSGNSAKDGGGIFNLGSVTVTNSTLSGNSAENGGGIFNAGAPTLNIANTIIANSVGGGGDFYGPAPTTNSNNLVEDASITGGGSISGDPLLGPLQNNGGSTFTMALGAGSPAIAAGNASVSNAPPINGLDQRGINRITSDIGAYSIGIQVTTTADSVDSGDSLTSLREAITLANDTPGNDEINFSLTGVGPFTITLQSALPAIVDAATAGTLAINGLGASSLTISGDNGNSGRDFNIFNINSGGNLNISGVTVSGAKTSGNGGAFNNSGTLTVTNSTISGNSTAGFTGGGAIKNNFGTVTVTNSTLSGNSATFGGSIENIGTVTVTNSTLSGNSAVKGGGINNFGTFTITNSTLSGNSAMVAGGIYSNSRLYITNSTLSGNSASNTSGGAIFNLGATTLSNSTLSGNSASTGSGGAIYSGSTSHLTVTNSTLSGNSASSGGGIQLPNGFDEIYFSTLNIANTILANSTGGDFAGTGVFGINTNNLCEDGSLPGAITGDPLLGPLQNNGGPTFTMALGAGSPAIAAGNATISNAPPINGLDQRGFSRLFSDIGALASSNLIQVTTTADTVDSGDGVTSLREAITLANSAPGNDFIEFNLTGISPFTITLQTALPDIIDAEIAGALYITGLGASSLTISGNNNDPNRDFSIFNIDPDGNLTISGVTISGAKTDGDGGAFNNSGTLTVTNSTLSGNSAISGGGIFNTGTLNLSNSMLSGNFANVSEGIKGFGGGIYNTGNLSIYTSTLSGNYAGRDGGAIFNGSGGTLDLFTSTLSGNSAAREGGGILNSYPGNLLLSGSTLSGNSATYGGGISNGGYLTVFNSTLSGNAAYYDGGGISNGGYLALTNSTLSGNTSTKGNGGGIVNNYHLYLVNSTLSGNSAANYGGGIYNYFNASVINSTISGNSAGGQGGGIFNYDSLNIANTITANSPYGGDIFDTGTISLIGTSTSANNLVTEGTFAWATTVTSAELDLGPLQNNGGPTLTIALGVNSVAIDAGDIDISYDPPVSGLDQRGINRTTADIGAYSVGIQVTTTEDTEVLEDGVTSLREAIILANTTPGDDAISFSLFGGPFTITLDSALPEIISANAEISGGPVGALTINGLGASLLTISGDNGDLNRDFNIFTIDAGGELAVFGVTISGAQTTAFGGAINNAGTLTVANSTLSGNAGDIGGAIYIVNGTVTVSNSTLSGNFANDAGGAIANGGYLTVINSTLSGNSAYYGGGIANKGTVTVSNSTLSGNSANHGSGIYNFNGYLTVTNSTLSGNFAYYGGGIQNLGTVTVTNSTLSGNSANEGGAIYNSGTLNIANTILANSLYGGDFVGNAPTTNSNNLVEDGSMAGAIAADPLLGPLQNNGGLTLTMALGAGSPAINAGNAAISSAAPVNGLDQRGINRTSADIGAYSFGIQVTTTADTIDPEDGFISLPEAIDLANITPGNDGIGFHLPGTGPFTITLQSTLPNIPDASTPFKGGAAGTLTINGPGAASLTISGDNKNELRDFNIFNIDEGGDLTITGVTISGAKTTGNGGAFYNYGALAVINSTISGNSANSGSAIRSYGTVTVLNSTISGNSAFDGGISNDGTLTVINSTLSGNFATNSGGGISNSHSGIVAVANSTFSGNSANYGGGISNSGTATVSNSTLSGNSANVRGGGIYAGSGNFTVINSTLSGNSATSGGGIYNLSNVGGYLNIANTIIANSTSGGDFAGSGPIGVNANNLCEDGSLLAGTYNKTGDPLLGPLQSNGGPTFTMALGATSPAIGAGATISNAPPVNGLDQRGFARSIDFPSIGAFEYYEAPTVTSVAPGSGPVSGGTTFTITGTNFITGPNIVTIDGVAATNVFVDSPTSITAITPAGTAGAKSVLVTSAGGTNAANALFTYVATTTTSLTSATNPSVFGQSVTFTATVASLDGTPSGSVTFKNGSTTIGTGALNGSGSATLSISSLAVGTSSITAVYDGNSSFLTSTSSAVNQVVNQAGTTTALTSGTNPSVFGESVTFTATVSAAAPGAGTPSGTVTFFNGAVNLGSGTLNSGSATLSISSLAVGTSSITAVYNADASFLASTSSAVSQAVNQAGTTTALTSGTNPSVFGESVTFTATVSAAVPGAGTPSGNVTFFDGLVNLGSGTLNSGSATLSISSLAVGTSSITAVYNADASFLGSTSSTPVSQVVNKAGTATALASSVNPTVFGQSTTFTATVSAVAPGSGTPLGTVSFFDEFTLIGTGTLVSGIATLTTRSLAVGNMHNIAAFYGGDASFEASSSPIETLTQVVNQAGTFTALASSVNPTVFGQATTFTATVTAAAPSTSIPSGTVTFKNGTDTLGTGTLNGFGVGTLSINSLVEGTSSITAVYEGTVSFVTSTSPAVIQTVNPSSAPLVIGCTSPNGNDPSNPGTSVNLYDLNTGLVQVLGVPFSGFMGELRVAAGDFNNDGKAEIVAAAGPGGGPAIAIMDSTTGAVLQAFFAYDPAFTGGVYVAVQDTNGDGVVDLVTGAGAGGGPHVKVFDGAGLQEIVSFFAYAETFSGGVSVGSADINGDNILDIVTGAGPGGGPHVKVFDGATQTVISQWYAYPVDFTGGVFVSMGDLGADGNFEVITGAGSGGGPEVAVFDPFTGGLQSQFLAYASEFSGGVRVGISDATGDGIPDLITGAGPTGGPHVKIFSYPELDLLFEFFSGPETNRDGVFVS